MAEGIGGEVDGKMSDRVRSDDVQSWNNNILMAFEPEELRTMCTDRKINLKGREKSQTCVNKLLEWKAQHLNLKLKNEELEAECKRLQKELLKWKAQHSKLQSDIKGLQSKNNELEAKYKRIQEDMAKLKLEREPSQRLTVKDVLEKPTQLGGGGIYIFEVKCLKVKVTNTSITEWCVAKVGRCPRQTFEARLSQHQQCANNWRVQFNPVLDASDKSDIVVCFMGGDWHHLEKKVRTSLGLPLGVGILEPTTKVVQKIIEDHCTQQGGAVNDLLFFKNKKIKGQAWKVWLGLKESSNNFGPTELIAMPMKVRDSLRALFMSDPQQCAWTEDLQKTKDLLAILRETTATISGLLKNTNKEKCRAVIDFEQAGESMGPLELGFPQRQQKESDSNWESLGTYAHNS